MSEEMVISFVGDHKPNRSQVLFAGAFPECFERVYLGTPRCGKTSEMIRQAINYCQLYPGSQWLLARWHEQDAASILKGDFYRECPPEILKPNGWDHEERKQTFRNGSMCYIHGLKPSEEKDMFGKVAGYSLSGIGLSQVEGIERGYVEKLFGRLSGKNPPRYMLLEGNLKTDSWLLGLVQSSTKVAERVYRSGPRMIVIGNLEDNAANLPDGYVEMMKARYPEGHPSRGPEVTGEFGVTIRGSAVYGEGVFQPSVHVQAMEAIPELPLLESWDFGLNHPAVTWSQWWPGGRLRVLGEYMGDHPEGTPLPDAMREVERLRREWFRDCKVVWRTGDPTGEYAKDVGKSSVGFLRAAGWSITTKKGANAVSARTWAIQHLTDVMQRRGKDGECFGIHPRCRVLIDALGAGYIKDPNRPEMPYKDGYYDHLANDLEYTVLMWSDGTGFVDDQPSIAREPGEPEFFEQSRMSRAVGGYLG